MDMSLHTEGDEYAMQAYAVEIEPGRKYCGVLVIYRMPGGEELYREISAPYGCCYGDPGEAVRQALAQGHYFIRTEQRRCKSLL